MEWTTSWPYYHRHYYNYLVLATTLGDGQQHNLDYKPSVDFTLLMQAALLLQVPIISQQIHHQYAKVQARSTRSLLGHGIIPMHTASTYHWQRLGAKFVQYLSSIMAKRPIL